MDEYTYFVNVEGAVVRDGEYLLVERAAAEEHAAGLLGFPGGKVETVSGVDGPIERRPGGSSERRSASTSAPLRDRKSTRLNSSHRSLSRMPSSA